MSELWEFLHFEEVLLEVLAAIGPLLAFFLVFQMFFLKLPGDNT